MKSIIILALSALLCLGSVTINAMDGASKGAGGDSGKTLVTSASQGMPNQLGATLASASEQQTYKAVAKITVVDYQSVQKAKGERHKVVDIAQVKQELATTQQEQAVRPQVVAIEDVRQELQAKQERELSLIQRYPKTSVLGFGTLCFICGLYFPEICKSVSDKLSSGTNGGQ